MSTKILLPDDADIKNIMESSFFHRDGFEFLTAAAGEDTDIAISAVSRFPNESYTTTGNR